MLSNEEVNLAMIRGMWIGAMRVCRAQHAHRHPHTHTLFKVCSLLSRCGL